MSKIRLLTNVIRNAEYDLEYGTIRTLKMIDDEEKHLIEENRELIEENRELRKVAVALLEYIDAIPDYLANQFPAMPGIDRDLVDEVINVRK